MHSNTLSCAGVEPLEDKLVPFDECCKVLGIELTLTKSLSGIVTVCNAQYRCDELITFMEEVLAAGVLTRCEGERLRGRLQFASNQLFGRRFRNCFRELNSHVARGFTKIADELSSALALMCCILKTNQPRLVDTNFLDWVHLYVDASFEPGGHSGLGGVLYNCNRECIGCFSEKVGQNLLDALMEADQKTAIFELEGLAIATAIDRFEVFIRGKRLVVFTDNQSVQTSVVRCRSKNNNMDLIIRKICSTEERLGIIAWIERVPSQSNPSDGLSREVHESY